VAIDAEYTGLFIQGLKWDSEDNGAALYDTIKAACRAKLTATAQGLVLVAAAGNGQTATYQLPQNGAGITPHDAAVLCSRTLKLFNSSKAELVANGIASPTDDQIFALMLASDSLVMVTETFPDCSTIRA
jgi:hypothetical protein